MKGGKSEWVPGVMVGYEPTAIEDPYLTLAAVILRQSANDYISTLRKLWNPKITIKRKRSAFLKKDELERFFHSDWFQVLTDMDADWFAGECRKAALRKEKRSIELDNRKKIRKMLKEGTL